MATENRILHNPPTLVRTQPGEHTLLPMQVTTRPAEGVEDRRGRSPPNLLIVHKTNRPAAGGYDIQMQWNDENMDHLRWLVDTYWQIRRKITRDMPKEHPLCCAARSYERLLRGTPAWGDCDWCPNRQKVLRNMGCFVCDLCWEHAVHGS